MRGGDAQTRQILGGPEGGVVRDGERQAAAPITELANERRVRARLGHQIQPGDAQLGDAVVDELHDVVGPDEENVEVEVLDARHQRPLAGFKDEPGVAQQPDRRFDQSALVWNGQAEAASHRVSSPVGVGDWRL